MFGPEYGWYSPEDQTRAALLASYATTGNSLASQIEQYNQQAAMSGQPGIPSLDSVGDPKQYLQLLAGSNPDLAQQLATPLGWDVPTLMQEASGAGYYDRAPLSGIGKAFGAVGSVGRTLQDNPALVFGAPLALAALGGYFGAGAAGAGATAGSGSATVTAPPIVSAGAAPAADGLAPIAVGQSMLPGGTGAGVSAVNGAFAGAPMATFPALAGGAAGGALSGLGLGGWLTLGSLGAQALQGNKDIVTNSTNAPPAYIAPYLSDAASRASTLYGQGNYVAPVTQSAIDYGTNVLNGSYLNSNPYLDATFNKAAGAVTNQLQSNFALSGRNARGVDAAGFAADAYNNLATDIYGGNYQAERQRQQQILPYAGQLGAYTNPGQSLDDYIARLRNLGGGYGTSTSSTPTQSNWLGGLAGLGLALMGP